MSDGSVGALGVPDEARRRRIEGFVLLAALALCWGLNWPAMKMALAEIPPWTFRTLCLSIGGGGLLAIAALMGLPLGVPAAQRRAMIWVGVVNITTWHLFTAYGLQLIEAGRASVIAFTMPLWAALIGVMFYGEAMTWRRAVGLGFGMAGLVCLVAPAFQGRDVSLLGLAFMFAAAIFWAIGTFALKRAGLTLHAAVLTGWQLLIGGVPIFILTPFIEGMFPVYQVGWPALLAAGYAVAFPMIIGHYAWVRVVQILPTHQASIGSLVVPMVAVFSGAIVLGERVGLYELAGLVLVVAALSLVMLAPAAKR
jgi:drug/metabolite transporter (DMT)-like permease